MHEDLEEASSRRSTGRLSVLAGVDGRAKNMFIDFLRGLAWSSQEAGRPTWPNLEPECLDPLLLLIEHELH